MHMWFNYFDRTVFSDCAEVFWNRKLDICRLVDLQSDKADVSVSAFTIHKEIHIANDSILSLRYLYSAKFPDHIYPELTPLFILFHIEN